MLPNEVIEKIRTGELELVSGQGAAYETKDGKIMSMLLLGVSGGGGSDSDISTDFWGQWVLSILNNDNPETADVNDLGPVQVNGTGFADTPAPPGSTGVGFGVVFPGPVFAMSHDMLPDSDWTIAMLIRAASTSDLTVMNYFDNPSFPSDGLRVKYKRDDNITIEDVGDSTSDDVSGVIDNNDWQPFAIGRSGSTLTIYSPAYIRGDIDTLGSVTLTTLLDPYSGNLAFNFHDDGYTSFAFPTVWSRVLDGTDVRAWWNSGDPKVYPFT